MGRLGDLVENGFTVDPSTPAKAGDTIGLIEGFKAGSDICRIGQQTSGRQRCQIDRDGGGVERWSRSLRHAQILVSVKFAYRAGLGRWLEENGRFRRRYPV